MSSLGELESLLDAWAELADWLDAEAVVEDEGSGAGDTTLIAFAMVFFFFFATGRWTTDNEPRPFSSGGFLRTEFMERHHKCLYEVIDIISPPAKRACPEKAQEEPTEGGGGLLQ